MFQQCSTTSSVKPTSSDMFRKQIASRSVCLQVAVASCLLINIATVFAKQKRTVPRENLYPLELEIGSRRELGGPTSTACFLLPLELQLDCPEAKTCGCQSSILTVTVDGSLVVMRSRIDEISDVFEQDSVHLNLTLCKLPLTPTDVSTPLEARGDFFAVDATLEHSSSGDTLGQTCRNISRDAVKECSGGTALGEQSTSSVVVESISSGSTTTDEELCAREGRCSDDANLDSPQRIRLASDKSIGGDLDGALRVLRRAEAAGAGEAALHQMALLPAFALARRCCDSVNEFCEGVPGSHKFASRAAVETDFVSVFGRDQCEGIFVEVGAGDGVTDSPTLYLEKMMGWTGLMIEGDEEQFRRLSGSGRGGQFARGELAVAAAEAGEAQVRGGKLDLREEISKMMDMGDETQQVQVVILNVEPAKMLPTLKAIDFSETKGYMGMLLPITNCIAVAQGGSAEQNSQVQSFLEARHYRVVKTIGRKGEAQDGAQGKTFELFMHMPPMPYDDGGAPEDADEDGDGTPEIEYHVSHDDDDEDDDE